MRSTTATLALTALVLSASLARADDANRIKLAREIVEITHLADKLRGLLPALGPPMRQALSQEMADSATIEATVRRVQTPSPEDLGRLMDEVASLYARELTEEDLSNILAFYRTSSGRNMLSKEAEIGGTIGVLAQHWASTIINRAVMDGSKELTTSPDPQRWRQDYISVPNRAVVLQRYVDPMDKPEWTALRTVTLAKLIADRCRGARIDQRVLDSYLDRTGLKAVSMGDIDTMALIIAPEFSYFDDDRLKLVCAAADDLFGHKGKLVSDLVSSGNGVPTTFVRGYLSISPFTDFPHQRG